MEPDQLSVVLEQYLGGELPLEHAAQELFLAWREHGWGLHLLEGVAPEHRAAAAALHARWAALVEAEAARRR